MAQPIYATRTLLACPDTITIDAVARQCDADYFASNVSGDLFTLATTEITNGMAHQVTIRNDSATDHSGKTVIINGYYGIYPVSETLNLPAANATIKSTKFFTKLPATLTPSADIGADTMDIGICEISITTLLKNNWSGLNQGVNIILVSGVTAIDYTVQFTRSKIEPSTYHHRTNCYTGLYDSWNWLDFDDTDAVNATTSISTNIQECPTGLRGLINSYTDNTTPVIDIEINQLDNL